MEWTYMSYTVANYGITFGLVLITILGVFVTYFSSRKGREFVIEKVIGINPEKAHDTYDDQNSKSLSLDTNENQFKQRSTFYIGIFCCLLGGMILSITAVLMFQGCFLIDIRLVPGDNCPKYTMDCFVFEGSSFVPIAHNATFVCQYMNKAEFPADISDATAWCYAWVIRYQSVASVLDQIGIAIALIGFFTTILAIIVYLGKSIKTIIVSMIIISSCCALILLLLFFKWSFAPLTYAILSLGITLGVFGLLLFCLLSKAEKQTNSTQILIPITNPLNIEQSTSSTKLSDELVIIHHSSKVTPL
ncbi:unnamed protein product [Adineta ricciae]|uniref:Uncharacterized protein n=1 Tax=Adineta ricciae TaxID=249248 RepID=A0A814Z657_ADIRI|nr:unnamed protein product [Adineta ricciae]